MRYGPGHRTLCFFDGLLSNNISETFLQNVEIHSLQNIKTTPGNGNLRVEAETTTQSYHGGNHCLAEWRLFVPMAMLRAATNCLHVLGLRIIDNN